MKTIQKIRQPSRIKSIMNEIRDLYPVDFVELMRQVQHEFCLNCGRYYNLDCDCKENSIFPIQDED